MNKPPCPVCKTNRHVVTHGREEFFCGKCNGVFDGDPEEGGTHSTFNPAARLEREERRIERRSSR